MRKDRENLSSWAKYEALTSKENKLVKDLIEWKLKKVRRVSDAKSVLETANKLQSWKTKQIKVDWKNYRTMDIVKWLDQLVVDYYKITKHKKSVWSLLEDNLDKEERSLLQLWEKLEKLLNEEQQETSKLAKHVKSKIDEHKQGIDKIALSIAQEVDTNHSWRVGGKEVIIYRDKIKGLDINKANAVVYAYNDLRKKYGRKWVIVSALAKQINKYLKKGQHELIKSKEQIKDKINIPDYKWHTFDLTKNKDWSYVLEMNQSTGLFKDDLTVQISNLSVDLVSNVERARKSLIKQYEALQKWETNKTEYIESTDYQKVILNFDIKRDRKNTEKVKELQKALIEAGHKLKGKNNGVDGQFGGSTKRAYESALATYKHVEKSWDITDKYIGQLKTINQYIDENSDKKELISSKIGIVWMIKSLMNSTWAKKIEKDVLVLAKKEWKVDSKWRIKSDFAKAFTATAMEAILNYALSGGTSVSIQIMWINVNSRYIDHGSINKVLKGLWIKDPVSLRDVLRKKPSTEKMEIISNLITKIHAWSLEYAADHVTGLWAVKSEINTWNKIIDSLVNSVFNILLEPINTLTGLSKKFTKVYKLIDQYESGKLSVDQKAKLSAKIVDELEKVIDWIEKRVDILEKDTKWIDLNNKNELAMLQFNDEDLYKKLEELINLKKSIPLLYDIMQKYAHNVANRNQDISNYLWHKRTLKDWINAVKHLDKVDVRKMWVLRISWWKYGLPLPKNWIDDTWIYKMTHNQNPRVKWISALVNIVREFQDSENLTKNVDIDKFAEAMKKGRYLTKEEKEEFAKVLNKNLEATWRKWNYKVGEDIYVFEYGTKLLFLKKDCSNVQDTTPLVDVLIRENVTITIRKLVNLGKSLKKNSENESTTKWKDDDAGNVNEGDKILVDWDNGEVVQTTDVEGQISDIIDPLGLGEKIKVIKKVKKMKKFFTSKYIIYLDKILEDLESKKK